MKFSHISGRWWWVIALLAAVGLGWLTRDRWLPAGSQWVRQVMTDGPSDTKRAGHADATDSHAGHGDHDHAAGGHDHGDHGHDHDETTSLALSPQGLRNIGLTPAMIRPVELATFRRSITVPAVVAERPGRTRVEVATPLTGVVMHVHAVQSEAVEQGTLLFQIRLTHEDLVTAQTEFLKTLGELDVEQREIERLTDVTTSGAVAGTVLLERQYARDKLEALLMAQREALRLHGLSEEQVDQIAGGRRLLRELQVFAPSADDHDDDELRLTRGVLQPVGLQDEEPAPAVAGAEQAAPLILQQLDVHKGQSVNAGETLAVLADYQLLFIEGQAFEQDIAQLRNASEREWTVTAVFEQPGAGRKIVEELEIAYLANEVDINSRTLHFYVRLPNEIAKDRRADGNRYIEWKYLPGQRLQLRVPVEEWAEQIVLPVDAVAREGAEAFVFQQNGGHFDRVPVHVKYRDQQYAVIANDGSLYPGDMIAMRGAHQMQIALKSKSGAGVADPHAGHSH
jgi:membrane fusion protein, heavy metal efflux system